MDESMDQDIQSVDLDEIIEAKDQLLRLLGVAEEQNECLEALAGAEADTEGLDFTQLRGMLSVLLSQAGATERMALRLEKHLGDLRQRYEGRQHARMNRRLAVLTVLSAVFLPLTLITTNSLQRKRWRGCAHTQPTIYVDVIY
jgi:Mg2+ and Co2+ transporter CorA